MKKEEIKQRHHHINKNVLAVLLVIAIIISLLGTYMTIINLENTPTIEAKPSTVGMVGVYVNNPNIPEEKEVITDETS